MTASVGSVKKNLSRISVLVAALLAIAGLQVVASGLAAVAAPACTIFGTAGQDALTGGPGVDVICGLGESDHLVGEGGNDHLIGGDGNDTLDGRDAAGNVDVLDCGPGRADRAFADQRDVVDNCEIVTQETTSPIVTLAPSAVAENEPVGTEVGQLGMSNGAPGGEYQFSLVAGPGGGDNASFTLSGRRLLTAAAFDYEADNEFSIRVRATDRSRNIFEQFFTVTVTDVNENQAPTDIALSNATVAENEPVATAVGTLSATDPDVGDTHSFTLVTGPGDTDNGSFQVTGATTLKTNAILDFETQSTYSIRVEANDGNGGTFAKQFTVTVTNAADAPTSISLSNTSVAEGKPVASTVGTLSATDPDTGDSHTFTLATGNGDADNGSFQVEPGGALKTNAVLDFEDQSTHTIRVRATDTGNEFLEKQFTITVTNANEAPTDVSVTPSTVGEDQPIGSTVGTLASIDPDAGDTFTYTLASGNGDGDNGSFTIDGGLLKTNAVLDAEADNSYSIRVRTTDAGGLHVEKSLTITISNVNEAPVAADDTYGVPPAGLVVSAPGVLGNDTDPEAGALTATLVSGPAHSTGPGGSFTLNPNGGFSYTPATGTVATTDSFTYRAVDPGTLTSNIATVTLALNQPPVAVNDSATTAEDTFVDIDVSANDTDAETANAGLTATSIASATGGSAVLQPGGRIIRFTPDEDFTGTGSFTYKANDGTSSSVNTATVTITVTGTNDAPKISDASPVPTYTEQANNGVNVSGNAVVSDVDDTDLASATITITMPLPGDKLDFVNIGNITGNFAGGVLTFTGSAPVADYQTAIRLVAFSNTTNEDPGTSRTITLEVNDGSLDSITMPRTVTVTPINDGPVVTTTPGTTSANEQVATVVDGGITVTDPDTSIASATVRVATGYLSGEDVLALPGQPLPGGITATLAGDTLSLTGTASAANYQSALRAVTYTNTSETPNTALRTVRFQVTDAGTPGLTSVIATRTIQPVDVPESLPPTDSGESYETTGNTWLYVAQPVPGSPKPARTSNINLLDNATDPDSPAGALTTTNVTQGAHGEVSLNPDGSFLYIPDVGYTGTDSFTYQVSDGTGLSAPSTVNVTIDRRVWYVSNSGSPFGDGTSSAPFQSLESADLAATAPNDIIYVRYGLGGSLLYDNDIDLMVGQQLLGEGVDLIVGGVTLFDVVEGSKTPLIDLTVNVDSGNTVRGLWWVGTHATPAIVGNAGDNGGTIMDVLIQGGRPGIELVDTTGDWTFWDATVDVTSPTGYALRAENAGILDFRDNGTNAFGGNVGGAVKILSTIAIGTIDSVTALAGSGKGVDLQNVGGPLTIGSINLTTSDTALLLDNADAITVSGGTATSTGGIFGIRVNGSTASTITIPSGSLSGNSLAGLSIQGGSGAITYGGSIGDVADPAGGIAVGITNHDSGEIRLSGQIDSNGSVFVEGGAAPVVITGANNVIRAKAITALSVKHQFVGPDGMQFKSLSTSAAAGYGIYLQDTAGGLVSVTGSGTAGSGGTLRTVYLEDTLNPVALDRMAISSGSAQIGIDVDDARRLVLRNSSIAGAGNGVMIRATEGQHEYVLENNTIAMTLGGFNRGIELTNPNFTAPTTNIWLIGNTVSGTELDGIALFAGGTSRLIGQITGNTISNYAQTGLWLFNTSGTADTDYTVTGNTLTDTFTGPNDSSRIGMAVESGRYDNPLSTGRDGGLLCLDATDNALSTSGFGNPGDFLLRVAYDAKFFIPGLVSNPGALFATRNNANGSPDGDVINSATPPGGFYAGTCDTLGAPPA